MIDLTTIAITVVEVEAIALLPIIIILRLRTNWLKTKFFVWINEYIATFLQEIEKKPEFVTKIIAPALPSLMNELQKGFKDAGGAPGIPEIGGIAGLLPIPKKYRALLSFFMPGGQNNAQSPGQSGGRNPFEK